MVILSSDDDDDDDDDDDNSNNNNNNNKIYWPLRTLPNCLRTLPFTLHTNTSL